MRTPLPRGERRNPLLDIQLTVHRPIGTVDGFGTHVFVEEARSEAELEAAIDRAFGRLRQALREAMR